MATQTDQNAQASTTATHMCCWLYTKVPVCPVHACTLFPNTVLSLTLCGYPVPLKQPSWL